MILRMNQPIDPAVLAEVLVKRLNDVLPASVRLGTSGSTVTASTRGTLWAYFEIAAPGSRLDSSPAILADIVDGILSSVQDFAAEGTGEPWPAIQTPSRQGSADPLPRANALPLEEEIRLWFGESDNPTLELPPIKLAELHSA